VFLSQIYTIGYIAVALFHSVHSVWKIVCLFFDHFFRKYYGCSLFDFGATESWI